MVRCLKIGEKNKLGVTKTYSCSEYSKIDKDFTSGYWCEVCTNLLINPNYYIELQQRREEERKEDWYHKR